MSVTEALRNFFYGTIEEQMADQRAKQWLRKKTLTPKERELQRADLGLSRRLFVKRVTGGIGIAGALASSATGIAWGIECLVDYQEALEKQRLERVYQDYVAGFELLAKDDPEAQEVLRFTQERRKRGTIKKDLLLADEVGDTTRDFYTIILDPKLHPEGYRTLRGFAEYRQNQQPTMLILKNLPVTTVWAGAITSQVMLNAYQWLTGIEASRGTRGAAMGDVDSYQFEFRLLNRYTNGQLQKLFNEQGALVPADKLLGAMPEAVFSKFNGLFPAALSVEETNLRRSDFIIGVNFEAIRLRSSSIEDQQFRQAFYLNMLKQQAIQPNNSNFY